MGIFGFGKARKIQDLNVKDLKKERITQEVKQDQLLTRIRKSGDQYNALLESASEPGLSDAEIDSAAYKMGQITKTKDRSEKDLQDVMTRLTVIDSTIDIIGQKRELEKKGIWKKINDISVEELESQIEKLAVERKAGHINLNRIVEMFDIDRQMVQSKRSADFRRSKDEILSMRQQKAS